MGILPALFFATALIPRAVLAQATQLRVQADLEYLNADIDSKNTNDASANFGEKTETDFEFFEQRYELELRKELFPNLELVGGGLFESTDSDTKTNGERSGFDQQTDRLYGEINLDNLLYRGGVAYRRNAVESEPRNVRRERVVREEFAGVWRWRPVGLPTLDLDLSRLYVEDNLDQRDSVTDFFVAKTNYDYREFSTDYSYTRTDADDRIDDTGSLIQLHNGGVRYPHSFLDDRLEVTGSARINFESVEPQGGGEVLLPATSPGAPFFFTDDNDQNTLTPVDPANPLTTINIGQNGPNNPVSVGLDFGAPTEVDLLQVFPLEDFSVPTLATSEEVNALAPSFTWQVFVSDDQQNWTPHPPASVPAPVPHDVVENRFEFRFPRVETRFIKVVVTPLSSAGKEVRIERLRAFTTVTADPGDTVEDLTQTYSLAFDLEATDRTRATLDSFVRIREDDPFDRRKVTLTNSVGVNHEFSPVFSGAARLLRTDVDERGRESTVRHSYTASLIADYTPSLNQRLIYSGSHDDDEAGTEIVNALVLRTNADIYRDWGVNLDLGFSARNPEGGPDTTSTDLRFATTIVPHRSMNLSVDYSGSWETETGESSGYTQITRFQAFWVPLDTLSLSGTLNLRDKRGDGQGLIKSWNYSGSWAPFPDGQLNFTLAYNRTLDAAEVETEVLTPAINLQLTRTTLITLSLDYAKIESDFEEREVLQYRANLRTFY